jgi:hypothetical protein
MRSLASAAVSAASGFFHFLLYMPFHSMNVRAVNISAPAAPVLLTLPPPPPYMSGVDGGSVGLRDVHELPTICTSSKNRGHCARQGLSLQHLQRINHAASIGGKFDAPSPSDQGAYLEFYRKDLRFMPFKYNFKPYWNPANVPGEESPTILHFHGAKPHHYLKQIMGDQCDVAIEFLCDAALQWPYLPEAMRTFAELSVLVNPSVYCDLSFPSNKGQARYCSEILQSLASRQEPMCDRNDLKENDSRLQTTPTACARQFADYLEESLNRVPDSLGLLKDVIIRGIRRTVAREPNIKLRLLMGGIAMIACLRMHSRMRRIRIRRKVV